MGVPVVTLLADQPATRVGASLLTQVGHPEWMANPDQEFVRIASDLASDVQSLDHLRQNLRQDMLNSTLGNAKLFARTIEPAYRKLWQTWCDQVYPQDAAS